MFLEEAGLELRAGDGRGGNGTTSTRDRTTRVWVREEEHPSGDFGSQWVRRVEAWENIYLCRAPGSHSGQTPEEELC